MIHFLVHQLKIWKNFPSCKWLGNFHHHLSVMLTDLSSNIPRRQITILDLRNLQGGQSQEISLERPNQRREDQATHPRNKKTSFINLSISTRWTPIQRLFTASMARCQRLLPLQEPWWQLNSPKLVRIMISKTYRLKGAIRKEYQWELGELNIVEEANRKIIINR